MYALSACSGDQEACDEEDCDAAGILAARYTAALAPSFEEVMEARRIYRVGFEALRGILGRKPNPHGWNTNPVLFSIGTVDSRFAQPWSRGELRTGVATVDGVLEQCHVASITGPGPTFFFRTNWYVAPQNIDLALSDEMSLMMDYFPLTPPIKAGIDVRFEFVDSTTVDVIYSIGWGDCWTACDGEHFWRVRVTASDQATLDEEWGDPIPDDVLASWQ